MKFFHIFFVYFVYKVICALIHATARGDAILTIPGKHHIIRQKLENSGNKRGFGMTIKEIAKLADVSITTVSKIVNGKDENISQSTRDKVLKIVREYNYTPYSKIKSLSTAKTFLLGVLLKDTRRSAALLDGITEQAQKAGYGILLFNSEHSPEQELKHITSLIHHKVDGVIWEPVDDSSPDNRHYLSEHGIPALFVNAPSLSDALNIDYEYIGYLMAQLLIKYKHSRIACLTRAEDPVFENVRSGVRKCLFDHQISCPLSVLHAGHGTDTVAQIVSHDITAIISTDFGASAELSEHLKDFRCSLPEDLSLVSIKPGQTEPVFSGSHVSGIRLPFYELGQLAARRMAQICKKEQENMPCALPVSHYTFDHENSVSIPPFLRAKKIVVVGSIHIDTTFSVDALPQSGETTQISNSSESLGGKGSNQAVGAARLGREVTLIGKVGMDADSFLILDTLKNEHVSTNGILHDKSTPTGNAFIYLGADGESAITILSGSNGNLTATDIKDMSHLFQNAGYVLLSGELPLPVILQAAREGRAHGCRNILKPAALKEIPGELMSLTDILIPNRSEASALCPGIASVEEQAESFLRQGAGSVIITLGHNGCYLRSEETARHFPAADFTPVDTTGGADAFIAALASYLIAGCPLENAIQIASYAAGFCISRQGVIHSLVDRPTLEAHIKRQEHTLLEFLC